MGHAGKRAGGNWKENDETVNVYVLLRVLETHFRVTQVLAL